MRTIAFSWVLGACASVVYAQSKLPDWLTERLEDRASAVALGAVLTIDQTQYQGQTVYWVRKGCCDVPSELYNAQGVLLCHPDGGFAGGDGRCKDFLATRAPKTRVWTRPDPVPGKRN